MKFDDHIWPILIAFLAALGCFTTVALVGGDGKLLEQVVIGLGGVLGGYAGKTLASNTNAPK